VTGNAHGQGLTVVAEQIAEWGGTERVIESLLAHYPGASLVVGGFRSPAGFEPGQFKTRMARRMNGSARANGHPAPGTAQLVRFGGRRHHYLGPWYAWRIRSAPLDGARAVLSLGAMAWTAAVRLPPGARHVAYLGQPRALYGHSDEYLRVYPPPLRALISAAMPGLRVHHRRLLAGVDRLVTNSRSSAALLERVAGREAEVVYPPARTGFFTPADRERTHHLVASRLHPHKRVDVVVEAFRRLRRPLVIAGGGPWLEPLRASAPPNVHFVGHVDDDEELLELYRSSRALVSASVEEFGLCLVEAQAAGVPVVAPRAGGAGEIVLDGETGVLLDSVDPGSIARAVERLESLPVEPQACRRSAERFSEERFVAEIGRLLGV
jgi:glycosyltransferase involved in cell wall biosynthesis